MEKTNGTLKPTKKGNKIGTLTQVITEIMSRTGLARRLGWQYGDKRKVYEALGYPTSETDLTFEYFYNKYDRQDIARAVIKRPTDATWRGTISIVEEGVSKQDSKLNVEWTQLNDTLKAKQRLNKVDKLSQIGRFSLLLFGLSDVKKNEDWEHPVGGSNLTLQYLRQVAESEIDIKEWENSTDNPRYGLPRLYLIKVGDAKTLQTSGTSRTSQTISSVSEITVHHSRVLHVVNDSLVGEVYGTPVLKPILNRLLDLEKLLGGSAETYWRGARPGWAATSQEGYEMGDKEFEDLMSQLDDYEHDLRRFLLLKGVEVNPLQQQISDPLNHIDAQLQAISAETGIPKRILIGTEEAKLAGGQDKDSWLSLIKTRQEEFAEPQILRPFVDMCMRLGVFPKFDKYDVQWEDIFAPSEADKVDVGKKRADALKAYGESVMGQDSLPTKLVPKYILGLNEEQQQEVIQAQEEQTTIEDQMQEPILDTPQPAPTNTEI